MALMVVDPIDRRALVWGNNGKEDYIPQSAAMTNRPSTASQMALLRDLICDRGFSNWIVVMLVISIPIAFGMAMSGLISSFIDVFIHPIIVMVLGNLQYWMIPLGNMAYTPDGKAIANGIYIGTFLAELLRFISNVIVLFCIVLVLKRLASRTN
jgi:large-conductance mechanosensitive channel